MCGYFCIGFIDFMLAGKTLTDFTNLFSPNNFKRNDDIILNYFMTNVWNGWVQYVSKSMHNSVKWTAIKAKKINKIKDYFVAEIKERELMSKRLSKYIVSFDYFDKSWDVLSVTTGSISIASFATAIGAPVRMMSASFSLAFSITTGIGKKLLKLIKNKKKKHNEIVMLARSKLNSIEKKKSEALINNEISHEGFMIIVNAEKKYRELKESIRTMNSDE